MPGMRLSLTIKSGTVSATRTSASAPLRAVTTSNPSPRRHAPTARKRFGSSSTTSNRFDILLLLYHTATALVPPKRHAHRESRPRSFVFRRTLHRDAAAQLADDATRKIEPEPHAGRFDESGRRLLSVVPARRRCGRSSSVKLLKD